MAYDPANEARLDEPWITAFRTERDLAIDVPINFVTRPGAALTQVCFANHVYEDQAAKRCFSNLLATGFKRFIVDVYWDVNRHSWSLCPMQVPNTTNSAQTDTIAASTRSAMIISSAEVTGDDLDASTMAMAPRTASSPLEGRQTSPTDAVSVSLGAPSSMAMPTPGNLTSLTPTLMPTLVPSPGESLFRLGQYQCTSSIDLLTITEPLLEYLTDSSNTLNATLTLLNFNLHLASSNQGVSSSISDSDLPGPTDLISNLLNYNLSSLMYSPSDLDKERSDLNSSWYSHSSPVSKPISAYYTTNVSESNVHSTPDGWPSEAWIELDKAFRIVVGFGQVDPQLSRYNFSGDGGTIFPPGAINTFQTVSLTSDGAVGNGCFLRNGTTSPSAINNSWAITDQIVLPASNITNYNTSVYSQSNLTACGISPLLNQSILDSTADKTPTAYKSIAYSSLWSWTSGQPSINKSSDSDHKVRCAALDTTLSGRWRVTECSERHRAACRVGDQPYEWQLSSTEANYGASDDYCGDNTTFSVPRTGLENSYLLLAVQQRLGDNYDRLIWLNFNSLDKEDCWVQGVNASCPYDSDADADHQRTVIVPTVAAVIIFILALLTIFVKCTANRANSRKRRRRKGDDGWDYEGVPS